jgi:hypothetical protein
MKIKLPTKIKKLIKIRTLQASLLQYSKLSRLIKDSSSLDMSRLISMDFITRTTIISVK